MNAFDSELGFIPVLSISIGRGFLLVDTAPLVSRQCVVETDEPLDGDVDQQSL